MPEPDDEALWFEEEIRRQYDAFVDILTDEKGRFRPEGYLALRAMLRVHEQPGEGGVAERMADYEVTDADDRVSDADLEERTPGALPTAAEMYPYEEEVEPYTLASESDEAYGSTALEDVKDPEGGEDPGDDERGGPSEKTPGEQTLDDQLDRIPPFGAAGRWTAAERRATDEHRYTLRRIQRRIEARHEALVMVLDQFDYLGNLCRWDELPHLEAPPRRLRQGRGRAYLDAALSLRGRTFDNARQFFHAIAQRAPKSDGTAPTLQAVWNWCKENDLVRPGESLEVFRPRIEATARAVRRQRLRDDPDLGGA